MGKIKKWYRSIPIWLAFFLVVILAFLIATFGTQFTVNISAKNAKEIENKYSEIHYETDDDGKTSAEVSFNYENYTASDMITYRASRFFEKYSYIFWCSGCIAIAGAIFYFSKIRKPYNILNNAYRNIAGNNLDFSIDYDGMDEMANLCKALETMRSALQTNNGKMLRMIEERKQLNDAYTHDLRTPISVLKGYTDMLLKYIPTGKLSSAEVIENVETMSAQISRLEQFVDSMNTVQKLDDIAVKKEETVTKDLINSLRETADLLCQSNQLTCEFSSSVPCDKMFIDTVIVTQVYENLIGNALRFANSTVKVQCEIKDEVFGITVCDDGKGFTDEELLKAVKPYYSGQAEKNDYHFGLGLTICRTLCEKHGGILQIANTSSHVQTQSLSARLTFWSK